MGNEKTLWNRASFFLKHVPWIRPPNDDSIPKDVSLPLVPYQKVLHDWLVVNRAWANAIDSRGVFCELFLPRARWLVLSRVREAQVTQNRDCGKSSYHGSFFHFPPVESSIGAILNWNIIMPTLLLSYLPGKQHKNWIVWEQYIVVDL